MWNWFNCYLSGRHEYGVWCEPGTIFLRCMHCGRRSPGWAVGHEHATANANNAKTPAARPTSSRTTAVAKSARSLGKRILPFQRAAAR